MFSLSSKILPRIFHCVTSRGVHQTAQTTQTSPIPLAKWHHHTAPQVTMYHTTWCSAVCGFIIRKPYKPHRTAPFLYINIFIFLILNILLINSLITLVFKKKNNNNNNSCKC